MLLKKVKDIVGNEYKDVKRCVLAYSGGLDSNIMVSLLQEMGIEVVTVCVDLGQKEVKDTEKMAKKLVKKHYTVDGKADFLKNINKGIKANCLYEGYLNSAGFSRPLIARYLAEVGRKEKVNAVVHGSSGYGNEQLIMENALRALGPEFHAIAPIRDWDLKRDECIEYARKKKLPGKIKGESLFSVDENLWARTIRQGAVLDQSMKVPDEAFEWTVDPKMAPDKKMFVEIGFENGIPETLVVMDERKKVVDETTEVVNALNKIGGANGVGRFDAIDDKVVGLKMREAREAPAACILSAAHKDLERLTLTAMELNEKDHIDHTWNMLVHDGGWYTRLRLDLEGFIDRTQKAVDGKVTVEIYKGGASIAGRTSRHALYYIRMGARDRETIWDQKVTRYFARLHGLQDSIAFTMED
jgi:argininosuccinate synthase